MASNGIKSHSMASNGIQSRSFTDNVIAMIQERCKLTGHVYIDGNHLTIAQVAHVSNTDGVNIVVSDDCMEKVAKSESYLREKIDNGLVVYGVNTGFGASANVRCEDTAAVQKALMRLLNAGFGEVFDTTVPRGYMLIRINSLSRGLSGVRPDVVNLLCQLVKEDITPLVPKRGSVSASGDLMPGSYIASAMMGRNECSVIHKKEKKSAGDALQCAKLEPITFTGKEALAVINSSSFATSLAANVLYHANIAALLTQVAVAMSVEALQGTKESFHPTIHRCMPHRGQQQVAENILDILQDSKLCVSELEMEMSDENGKLKQDRYGLRTAAQWLGPVLDLLEHANETVNIDLNSTNDNPIIDHINNTILHGGNFQGTAVAVAMDTSRQALQLCGKLMFALMSEIVNVNLNKNATPNLSGCDVSCDFGFKGADIAMTSYMSELDLLTSPVTRHVLSAEMANQAVNSLALLSARWSEQALTVLQQMLANIIVCQAQAIDLRWLKEQVIGQLKDVFQEYNLDAGQWVDERWPWYMFVFNTEETVAKFSASLNGHVGKSSLCEKIRTKMAKLVECVDSGMHIELVEKCLGTGTKLMYSFIRKELGIEFYTGKHYIDMDLQSLHASILDRRIEPVVLSIFK